MADHALRDHLSRLSPPLSSLYAQLIATPVSVRKDLLTIVRCQSMPSTNSRLAARIPRSSKNFVTSWVNSHGGTSIVSWNLLLRNLEHLIKSPVRAGFASMLIREVRLDEDDLLTQVQGGIRKELSATCGPDRAKKINYDAWFSSDDRCRDWEITDHIPSRRTMSEIINAQFRLWRGVSTL